MTLPGQNLLKDTFTHKKSEKNPISELNVFVRINDEYLILSFSV